MTDSSVDYLKRFDDIGGRFGSLMQRLTNAYSKLEKENAELKKMCSLLEAEKIELTRENDVLRKDAGTINNKISELLEKVSEWEQQVGAGDGDAEKAADSQQQSLMFS